MDKKYQRVRLSDLYSEEAILDMKQSFEELDDEEKVRIALVLRNILMRRIKECYPDILKRTLRSRAERIMLQEFGIHCPKMCVCA